MTIRLKAPYKDLTRFELNKRSLNTHICERVFARFLGPLLNSKGVWINIPFKKFTTYKHKKMHFCKAPQMKNRVDRWIVQFSVPHLVCVLCAVCVCVCVCVVRACVPAYVWYERSMSPRINPRYSREHYGPWCVILLADGVIDEPCAWRSNSCGKQSFCRGSRRKLHDAAKGISPAVNTSRGRTSFTASFQRHCLDADGWATDPPSGLGWEIWVDREKVGANMGWQRESRCTDFLSVNPYLHRLSLCQPIFLIRGLREGR